MDKVTLTFEGGMTKAYPTCREFIQFRVHHQGCAQKAVAADMDYSPSTLTRKLAQSPDDSQRFTLDDLERFISVTGDTSPIMYLVEKYITKASRIKALEAELASLREENNEQA